MRMEKHEITSYSVSIVSAKRGPAATIHALSPHKDGQDKDGQVVHVYLRYYRAGYARPDNSRIESDDGSLMYMISYRFEQLAASVDLLRNEKPMFFVYNAKSGAGYLATDVEPVGEGPEDADGELEVSHG